MSRNGAVLLQFVASMPKVCCDPALSVMDSRSMFRQDVYRMSSALVVDAVKVRAAAADPGEDPADPREDAAEPREDPTDPGEDPADPGEDAADPREDAADPGEDAADPMDKLR